MAIFSDMLTTRYKVRGEYVGIEIMTGITSCAWWRNIQMFLRLVHYVCNPHGRLKGNAASPADKGIGHVLEMV